MIERAIERRILDKLSPKKAIILLGPRQVGKSTLIKKIADNLNVPMVVYDGDEAAVRASFKDAGLEKLRSFVGSNQLLIVDEAQRIENIGLALKIVIDQIGSVKIIATVANGSSTSFLSVLPKWCSTVIL
jgi:predicted AAA+ superfamily ATPase